MIDRLIFAACGQRAECDAADASDQQSPDTKFEGCRQSFPEIGNDALTCAKRGAEVALHHVLQILHVLLRNRPVESPAGLRSVDDFLIAQLAFPDDRGERVRRNQSRNTKGNGDDPQQQERHYD